MDQPSPRYTYIRYAYLAALTVVAVVSVLPITLPIRLWVLCAVAVLIGGALWRTSAPESATPPPAPRLSRRTYGLIFITIIALSALASYELDRQYLWTDDVISFMAAERLLLTGSTTFETGLPYPGAALYHHLLAGSLWLFGSDVFGSRIINIGFLALILSLAAYTLRRYGLPTILIGILDTRSYTLTVTNAAGDTYDCDAPIVVLAEDEETEEGGGNEGNPALSCEVEAVPSTIGAGGATTLVWSSTGAVSAKLSPTGSNSFFADVTADGSWYISGIQDSRSYTVTVFDAEGNTATCNAPIAVEVLEAADAEVVEIEFVPENGDVPVEDLVVELAD